MPPNRWGRVIREMAASGTLVGRTMTEDGKPDSATTVVEVVIEYEGTTNEFVRFIGEDWMAGCRTELVGYGGDAKGGLRIHAMGLGMSWTFMPPPKLRPLTEAALAARRP